MDGLGQIRYVGQTTGRLRTRWRTPPLALPVVGNSNPHIFHNIAWPYIEEAFATGSAAGTFVVLAIGAGQLATVVAEHGDLKAAVDRLSGDRCLSLRVETWVCDQLRAQAELWNRAKRQHRFGTRRVSARR